MQNSPSVSQSCGYGEELEVERSHKGGPDAAGRYVLSAKYLGNAEPVVKCLGRKLAKAHGDSFPAFNQMQGGWSN